MTVWTLGAYFGSMVKLADILAYLGIKLHDADIEEGEAVQFLETYAYFSEIKKALKVDGLIILDFPHDLAEQYYPKDDYFNVIFIGCEVVPMSRKFSMTLESDKLTEAQRKFEGLKEVDVLKNPKLYVLGNDCNCCS